MNPLTPYVKTAWVNDDRPDIDAEHLNHLEQGLYDATLGVNGVLTEAQQAKADAAAARSIAEAHAARVDNPHQTTAAQIGATGGGGGGGGLGVNAVTRGARGDNAFDNTTILQALLDEIRNAGGGTLLLPPGTYRTRCLWVPSNCEIIGNAATLVNIGWSTDTRYASWDGDQIAASGLLSIYPQTKFGYSAIPSRIFVSGVRLDVSSARPDGVLTYGFDIGGSYVTIDRCEVVGDPKDCINMGDRRGQELDFIHVSRSHFTGARRNNISIEGHVRYVWIKDSRIGACSGVPTPVGAGQMDNSPGAGIYIEQGQSGQSMTHIYITRNYIHNNAGAGIVCNFFVQPGDTLDDLVFEGNRISDNGGNPQGGVFGGIWLGGGRTDNCLRIVNNTFDGTRSGAHIQGQTAVNSKWRHKTLIANNYFEPSGGGNVNLPGVGQSIIQANNI